MTSELATWNWTKEHQKAFEHTKKTISGETSSVHLNFSKPFVIHTDDSKVQLGAVISQDNKPKASILHRLITHLQKENYYWNSQGAKKHPLTTANKSIYFP